MNTTAVAPASRYRRTRAATASASPVTARPAARLPDPVPGHQAVQDAVRDQDPARAEPAVPDLPAKAIHDLDQVTRAAGSPWRS
ncbi:hypothetical protein [Streptomyces caelestis]|uniref:hypothetical protein n=1 Tax=Streptomyces caelestis TaxID=36816 RepID=UPI00365A372C